MKRKNMFCVGLVLALGAFSLITSQAFAYGSVGGAPLVSLDPTKKGWFVYQLGAGESYDDTFVVRNSSDKPWIAVVYPADQVLASGGGFALKPKGAEMSGMGKWVKMEGANENGIIEVLLEPGEQRLLPFTITIPHDVEIGETAGAILVEKKDPETAKSPEINSGRSGVVLSMRTGTRIYNTVPGDIHEELVVGKGKFFKKGELNGMARYLLSYDIENKGSISTNAKIITTAKNIWRGGDVFYDTTEEPPEFIVSPAATFDYNGRILMPKFGKIEVSSKVFMVGRKGEETQIAEEYFSVIIIPWKEVGFGALVIALIVFFFVWRRRKYSGKGWDNYTVKSGDTVTTVAEKHGIDWEFLVKVNRIKSPFLLTKGQKILVPPPKKKKK